MDDVVNPQLQDVQPMTDLEFLSDNLTTAVEAEIVEPPMSDSISNPQPEFSQSGNEQSTEYFAADQQSVFADNSAAQPVYSAKDAINAMYAAWQPSPDQPQPVTSAKDAINAAAQAQSAGASSAANLHKHSGTHRQVESVRPSASALFRTARSSRPRPSSRPCAASSDPLASKPLSSNADTTLHQTRPEPIIRTSLKLGPKKPPIVMNARSAMNQQARSSGVRRVIDPQMRPRKGQTRLMQDMVRRPAAAQSQNASTNQSVHNKAAINTIKAAASAVTQNTVVKRAPRPTGTRVFQDVIRPTRPVASALSEASTGEVATVSAKSPIKKPKVQKSSKLRPLDSIKNRFRPAPKGYSASTPDRARPNRPHQLADYQSPSHPATTEAASSKSQPSKSTSPQPDSIFAQTKEAIHFYGMTEGPEKPANSPAWHMSDVNSQNILQNAGLGIVEDYQSQGDSAIDQQINEAKANQSTPDNNRYALGSQSPFFLKSVKVEKRPLSDSSPFRSQEPENPIYSAQELEQTSKKNIYEKQASPKAAHKSKKSQPTKTSSRPTVIIPSRRRSHTPMVALLIVTIILGAIVGGAAYIFFFQ